MPSLEVKQNEFGQPIGFNVEGWSARQPPPRKVLQGKYCTLEPLDASKHAESLWNSNAGDVKGQNWTYLFVNKPADLVAYKKWLEPMESSRDPMFYVICDPKTGNGLGIAAYLRIDLTMGSIEVGHINFSPLLQRTRAATEAIYLMIQHAFDDLGYRRFEWKCDSLNAPSRSAAARFGFTFEGIFRNHMVYKGRNRDTAWFGIADYEWPAIKAGYEAWLDESNFDAQGKQIARLEDLRKTK